MNGWNTFRRCLGTGVVAVGLLVVTQGALARPGHCCTLEGDCITIYSGDSCGNYECHICAARPCFDPTVVCPFPSASGEPGEGTNDEAVSTASQPEVDASEGKTKAESGVEPTPRAGAVGPASSDASLVDAAAAMDHDAGVCLADPLEDAGSATSLNGGPECFPVCHDQPNCTFLGCCWLCGNRVICQATPLPG